MGKVANIGPTYGFRAPIRGQVWYITHCCHKQGVPSQIWEGPEALAAGPRK